MQIVYLAGSGQLGGAERFLLDLLESVHHARPDWRLVVVVPAEGPLVARVRQARAEAVVVAYPPALAALGDAAVGYAPAAERVRRWRGLAGRSLGATLGVVRYAWRLRRALAALRPDVVHSHGFKMHVLGAWARPRRARLVWHLHDRVTVRPLMSRLLRWHRRATAAAVAVSRSVAEDASASDRGLHPHVVLNGVDLDVFTPAGPALDLDRLAGLPPAPPGVVRVGLVGTAGRFKGHDVFLRALARLPGSLAHAVRGYVVGGPLYTTRDSQVDVQDLRELAAELGIADRVGFTGFVDDPAAAMRALDVVVHASTQPEPFGLVIAEAMGCGRAVIASEAGGAREIVRPGLDALTHPPGDADALAAAIATLAADAGRRAALGAAGRRAAEARFDRRRLGEEMVAIYERVAARGERVA